MVHMSAPYYEIRAMYRLHFGVAGYTHGIKGEHVYTIPAGLLDVARKIPGVTRAKNQNIGDYADCSK